MKQKIGILAGLGIAAGVYWLDILVKECVRRGCVKDDSFPEVVFYSVPSAGIGEKGINDADVLKKDLLKGITYLNLCDCTVISVCCNTAHAFYDYMQKHSRAKILNMIQLAIGECGGNKYGVLSTRSTRDRGLYGGIHTTDKEQVVVQDCIDKATYGKATKKDTKRLAKIIDAMMKSGANKVILGCTEIPLVAPKGPNIIDAGEVVIKKMLDIAGI